MKRALLLSLLAALAASPAADASARASQLARAAGAGAETPATGAETPAAGGETPRAGGETPGLGEGLQSPEGLGGARQGRDRTRGRCRLSLEVASAALIAGETATLTGTLSCPLSEEAGGRAVTIEQHTAGVRGYQVLGTVSTEAGGAFHFTTQAGQMADGAFRVLAPATRAARAAVRVHPAVSLHGPAADTQLLAAGRRTGMAARAARAVVFSGTVSPAQPGALVVLQREDPRGGESWRRIGLGEISREGRFSIVHEFSLPGPAVVRVVVHVRGMRATASEVLDYEVAQPQNPRLTIMASPSTASYGQTVAIGGVAAAGTGARLTLIAQTRGGAPQAVASVTAAAGGDYEFPPQTLTHSLSYRVSGGGISSSRLRESVRPLLSLGQLPGTAEIGAPLQLCGTLAPAGAGAIVYLQRQNPSGDGFHAVGEAPVAADGAFCLEEAALAPGTHVYRVRVAPTAELGPAASASFAVHATQAAGPQPQQPPAGEASG